MTDAPEKKPDLAALKQALAQHGVVAGGEAWEIRAIAAGSTRKAAFRREHFQVIKQGRPACHVVAGRGLAPEYRRALEFHAACPALSCRPLFHHPAADGMEWLGFEYFAGTSLDERVAQGAITPEAWLAAVRRVQAGIETTRRPSTAEALRAEVKELLQQTLDLGGWSAADRQLLQVCVPPIMAGETAAQAPTLRFSSGDFCARNILMNDAGELRLIDHEFAGWTHFGGADWLRLKRFSRLPADAVARLPALPEGEHEAVAQELYLCLQHFRQLQQVEPAEVGEEQLSLASQRLLHALAPASVLIRGSALGHQRESAASAERAAWAQSLDDELRTAREQFARLQDEQKRQQAWALSLDAELQESRKELARVQREFEERTAWTISLEKNLEEATRQLSLLQRGFEERTAWARSLEKELAEAVSQLTSLQRQFEERTAWALSLEREVAILNHRRLAGEAEQHRVTARGRAAEGEQAAAAERLQVTERENARLRAELAKAQLRLESLLGEVARPVAPSA